jgi:hypothetical protein
VLARGAGGRLFVGGGEPSVAELDLASGRIRPVLQLPCTDRQQAANRGWMVGLQVTHDGRDLTYAVEDGRLGRVDAASGRVAWETPLGVPVVGSALYPDGQHLAVVLGDGAVVRIRVDDGGLADPVEGRITPADEITRGGLWFSPSGDRVAEANRDGLTLRRSADRHPLWTAPVYDRIVVSAAWLPSGNAVVAGTAGNTVQIFPASGMAASMILRGHGSWVTALHPSPSGRYDSHPA